jgi:integrase
MRGQGRVYQPEKRRNGKCRCRGECKCAVEVSAAYMLDYTVSGVRYREAAGTDDYQEALAILTRRRAARENGAPVATGVPTLTLKAFVAEHIAKRRQSKKFTEGWIDVNEQHLTRAVEQFGAERKLASITVQDVAAWSVKLQDAGVKAGTVLHHLHALQSLFKRARATGRVPSGFDPVSDFKALGEAPERPTTEAQWLEVSDAALLLEAARTYPHDREKGGRTVLPFIYELAATLLLTGGRESEVLGLEVDDLSFDRKAITFRPNQWRRLKTKGSQRTVRMWPQLEEILRPHVFNTNRPPARLLFPSPYVKPEGMVEDWRKSLDAVAVRAGWKAGEIRSKQFRHTYATARLQTTDRGAPVAAWTVAKELGHTGTAMIEKTYGHLGEVRHRADAVEYRVEQHAAKLGDRLSNLVAVTSGNRTGPQVAA